MTTRRRGRRGTVRGGALLVAIALVLSFVTLAGAKPGLDPFGPQPIDEEPDGIPFWPCASAPVRNAINDANDAAPLDIGKCEQGPDGAWYLVPGDDTDPSGALDELCTILGDIEGAEPAHETLCDDEDQQAEAGVTGSVVLRVDDDTELPAIGATVTATSGTESESETVLDGSYSITLAGGKTYVVCASHPLAAEEACAPPVSVGSGQVPVDQIELELEVGPGIQEEIMKQVPAALNCGGHTTLGAWLFQTLADADCNDWHNDQELQAGCNPFNPQETPANPQTCNGPKPDEVDPTDPDSVLRAIAAMFPPGLNCGNHQDPVSIVLNFLADADCNDYDNDQELPAGCNPLNPWSYPGSPFPGACVPEDPTEPTEWETFVLRQSAWAEGYAYSLLHPWVLWVVFVVLGVVGEQDLPDPDDLLPP